MLLSRICFYALPLKRSPINTSGTTVYFTLHFLSPTLHITVLNQPNKTQDSRHSQVLLSRIYFYASPLKRSPINTSGTTVYFTLHFPSPTLHLTVLNQPNKTQDSRHSRVLLSRICFYALPLKRSPINTSGTTVYFTLHFLSPTLHITVLNQPNKTQDSRHSQVLLSRIYFYASPLKRSPINTSGTTVYFTLHFPSPTLHLTVLNQPNKTQDSRHSRVLFSRICFYASPLKRSPINTSGTTVVSLFIFYHQLCTSQF